MEEMRKHHQHWHSNIPNHPQHSVVFSWYVVACRSTLNAQSPNGFICWYQVMREREAWNPFSKITWNIPEPSRTCELNLVESFKMLQSSLYEMWELSEASSRDRSGIVRTLPGNFAEHSARTLWNGTLPMGTPRWTLIFSNLFLQTLWQWLQSLNLQGFHPTSANPVLISFVFHREIDEHGGRWQDRDINDLTAGTKHRVSLMTHAGSRFPGISTGLVLSWEPAKSWTCTSTAWARKR